jgi:micrococcal nuclease
MPRKPSANFCFLCPCLLVLFNSGCGDARGAAGTNPAGTNSIGISSTGTRSTIESAGTVAGEGAEPAPGSGCVSANAPRQQGLVTYVTDGDSIEVDVGGVPFRVRYIGIDAPEMTGGPLAEESAAANRKLVAGKTVVMVRDLSEADRYGRLLRYVFADGVFVNREMVRLGLAWAGYFPPDLACAADLKAAEEEARQARLGLWGLTGSPTFLTRTGAGCGGGCLTPPAGCRIKGNINAEGVKIYHVPGGKYYEQTVIEPEKGERWFCSEAEAVAAGWRKSKV